MCPDPVIDFSVVLFTYDLEADIKCVHTSGEKGFQWETLFVGVLIRQPGR